jgi:chromate transport protein ChrA
MEMIKHLMDVLGSFMSGTAFAAIAMILEMALRLTKSEKPIGIIHMISGFLKAVAGLFSKVAELLDKVLPQNLK